MRALLFTVLLVLSTVVLSQKNKSYECFWHGTGDITTVPGTFSYSDIGKFYYHISNDNENLYVDLKITERDVQRYISRSGLSFFVSINGKKSRKYAVKYPVREGGQAGQGGPGGPSMPRSQSGGRMGGGGFGEMPGKVELVGFQAQRAEAFKGSIKPGTDGLMWYELIIPLSDIRSIPIDSKKNEQSMLFGFEYTGAPVGGGRAGAGQPGGGDMPPASSGGGSRGGRGRGSVGTIQPGTPGAGFSSENKISFWIKNVKLAKEGN